MVLYQKMLFIVSAVAISGASCVGGYYLHQHLSKDSSASPSTPPRASTTSTGGG